MAKVNVRKVKAGALNERTMGATEFQGVMAGAIPVCDEFGEFNDNGLAVVKKNGLYGVVNKELSLVVSVEYDAVKLLETGHILVLANGNYFLHTQSGVSLLHPPFESEEVAIQYANNL